MAGLIGKYIDRIEDSGKSLTFFIWLFIFATTVRNLIEPFSTGYGWHLKFIVHSYFWYICLALCLITVIALVVREKVEKVSRVVLSCFIILLIVPFFDILLTGGHQIEYFSPNKDYLGERYVFSLFVQKKGPGASAGQRIEIATILFFSMLYFLHKTKSFLKSILGVFAIYNVVFFLAALPFGLYWISKAINAEFPPDRTILLTKLLLVYIFIAANSLFYATDKSVYFEIMKNMRWLRLGHYWLMLATGMVIAGVKAGHIDLNIFLNFMLVCIAIIFAGLYSIIVNDIHDVQIDRISNPERPLITKAISHKTYKKISGPALYIALVYAVAGGWMSFLIISAVALNYYIYSAPPIRIKRFLYSKYVISFNTLLVLLLGYHIAGKNIMEFPKIIIAYVLIMFTACINFIDLKDYEGDKKAKIRTLPTVLGLEKSKRLIGVFFLFAYAMLPFSYDLLPFVANISIVIVFSAVFGLLEFMLVNRKKFNEKYVFWTYEASLLFFTAAIGAFGKFK